jgi:hypothetical protein
MPGDAVGGWAGQGIRAWTMDQEVLRGAVNGAIGLEEK